MAIKISVGQDFYIRSYLDMLDAFRAYRERSNVVRRPPNRIVQDTTGTVGPTNPAGGAPGILIFPPPPVIRAPPPVSRPPFILGEAANDPVFSIGKQILRRGLGAVNIAIIVADILKMGQEIDINKQMREREAEDVINSRRSGRKIYEKKGKAVFIFGKILLPRPDFFPKIGRPAPGRVPKIPNPTQPPFEPPRVPRENPRRLPDIRPSRPNIPRPQMPPNPRTQPGRRTAPGQSPASLPKTTPKTGPNPFLLTIPAFFGLSNPFGRVNFQNRPGTLRNPFASVPGTPNLPIPSTPTLPVPGGNIGTIVLPSQQPQPQADTARKCETVKRRRRKKGKCRQGYFRETPTETNYTTWREKDCGPPKLRTV